MVRSRRIDNQTKFAFYRYGSAYLTGLSDPIRMWQNTAVFKIERRGRTGKLIGHESRHAGLESQLEMRRVFISYRFI